MTQRNTHDFEVIGGGTVYVLQPLTNEAQVWIDDHIDAAALYHGRNVAVEHRYIGAITRGILADGFSVSKDGYTVAELGGELVLR